ncbi:hypothetical protein CVT24_006336 [Panaeolus cyanescens]|uniref:DUF6534 domain-containing protein n=1 Tax=Panaeolus cyanescens TaxID=181874 RepID=A0A409YEC4_9AGAR|nr:hypothetical protein CVT24_006336 [Panaeolus cyanescens]
MPTHALQSTATLVCDLLITGSLLSRLNSTKTGIKATNTMLDKLMINAVNRGGLTALAAALNLFLFVALPNSLWFLIGLFLSSKLYMNSALAFLNSRRHLRNQFRNVTLNEEWRAMETLNFRRAETSSQKSTINISMSGRAMDVITMQESEARSEEIFDTKKRQLVTETV